MNDREIDFLCTLRPSLRGRLRRNRQTGCLEWTGPKIGRSAGNPLLLICKGKKKRSVLLRRWVWHQYFDPLPTKQYPIMKCLNYSCVEPHHMMAFPRHFPYRKSRFLPPTTLSDEIIILAKYFHRHIPDSVISRWTKINRSLLRAIMQNKRFAEVQIPSDYVPSDAWIRKAEQYSHQTRSGHYLGPTNLKKALRDIHQSALSPTTKDRLSQYVRGREYTEIALDVPCDYSSVRESVKSGLRLLSRTLGKREWIRLLIKTR